MLDFNELPIPFRMQPGLRRIEEVRLHALAPTSDLFREKQQVWQAGQSRLMVSGFDPGPALAAIEARLPPNPNLSDLPLELRVEEDLAVLDSRTGTLPWLCICTPTHWAPEEKLGLSLTAVHAPVADNPALIAAIEPLVAMVTKGGSWERSVWTLTPSAHYDLHPHRHPRQPWPDDTADAAASPQALARQCFVRTEKQRFFPVPAEGGIRQAVFAIHTRIVPLDAAVQTATQAQRLHHWLASMSPAVLAYKNLAPVRGRILAWLQDRINASA